MAKIVSLSSDLLIKFFLLAFLFSCNETKSKNPYKNYDLGLIELPSGKKLTTYLAKTDEQQQLGLSHIQDQEFKNDEAMLFLDESYSPRQFWMPNTHFNLDIIFLNEDFYVLDIHRNLEHYKSDGPKSAIPISKRVYCKHVLEVKSSSPLAREIEIGMVLKWISPKSLLQK
jgi:uncharacterized membrane protein (UPF0127 family)